MPSWPFSRFVSRPNCESVYIPTAKSNTKLSSRQEFGWQYLFPSNSVIIDKTNNIAGRHHIDETVMRKQFKKAIKLASINKAASTHTFRHSFATQCILNGMDIRTLQQLLGHANVNTTQLYLHVAELKQRPVTSPLDALFDRSYLLPESKLFKKLPDTEKLTILSQTQASSS